MDNALRKLAQSVQVIRSLHRGTGGRDAPHEPHQRAEEQGYSIKGYHFTRGQRAENIAKTGKFDPTQSFNPDEEAVFFWTHPEAANEWAHIHGSGAYPNTPMGENALNRRNPVIMPVRVNPGKHIDIDWLEHSKHLQQPAFYNSQLMGNLINHAKKNGYDTMRIRNMSEGMSQPHDQFAVLNPTNIRSEFAQFNPERQHENDIGAHTGGYIKGYATKGAVTDPLELAKSVKPLAQPISAAPTMTIGQQKLHQTFQKENRPAVIIGTKPGMGGGPIPNPNIPRTEQQDANEKGWNFTTPTEMGEPMPPAAQAPTRSVNHDNIASHVAKFLKAPGFKNFIKEKTGIENLRVTPSEGTWQQQREPVMHLTGDNMNPQNSRQLGGMLGFGTLQDYTVQDHHNPDLENGTPTVLIGNGKPLNEDHIAAIKKAASNHGVDYRITTDRRAAKFQHFGEDDQLEPFFNSVKNVADEAQMPDRLHVRTDGGLLSAKEYLNDAFGGSSGEVRLPSRPERSPDLFNGIVHHILGPYARAIASEGYRVSPERLAQQFGLTPQEEQIVREHLYPTAKDDRSTVPLMTGEEKLDVRPTGDRGQNTVNDILYGLQNRAAQKGQIDPGDYSDRAQNHIAKTMADEVAYHAKTSKKSAIGWYDEALKLAKNKYAEVFPEIKTDRDKGMLFDAILGITSQGNDVHSNSIFTARLYNLVRDGKMSLPDAVKKLKGTFGNQTNAIEQNLEKYHHLVTKNGYDRMDDLFNRKMTVAEWNKILRQDPTLHGVNGEPLRVKGQAQQKVNGWMVFGPKIGSFINNLHGDYSTLTADLWFSRTWGRMLGHNFLHTPIGEAKQYRDYRDAMKAEYQQNNRSNEPPSPKTVDGKVVMKDGKPVDWEYGNDMAGMSREDFQNLYDDPEALLEHANKVYADYDKGGYKEKSDLRRRAKNWIQNRDDAVAAPRSDRERAFQQATAERAQQHLKKKYGMDISVADIQAALWFHEKELLGKFGATTSKSAPADYADAANRAIALHKSGDLYTNVGDLKKKKKNEVDEEPEHEARGGSVRRAYMKGGKVEGSIWHERDAFDDGGKVHPDLKMDQPINDTGEHMSKARVDVPVRWASAPNHPSTHLAYITEEEAKLLKKLDIHNSGVRHEHHIGPAGLPSYDDRGSGGGGGSSSSGSDSGGSSDSGGGSDSSTSESNGNNDSDPLGNSNSGGIGPSSGFGAFGDPSKGSGPLGFDANSGATSPQTIKGDMTMNTTPAGRDYISSVVGHQIDGLGLDGIPMGAGVNYQANANAVNKSELDAAAAKQMNAINIINNQNLKNAGIAGMNGLGDATSPNSSLNVANTPSAATNAASIMDAAFGPSVGSTQFGQTPLASGSFTDTGPITSATGTPAESLLAAIQPSIGAPAPAQLSSSPVPMPTPRPADLNPTENMTDAQKAAQQKMDTGVQLDSNDMSAMTDAQRQYAYENGLTTVGTPTGDFFGDLFSGKLGYTVPTVDTGHGGGDGNQFNGNQNTPNKTHMVQKLMPDGTYQWVEQPFKKGGKVYRPLVGSQMTDHVISKFGVPLSASKYQPNGNKAGRR